MNPSKAPVEPSDQHQQTMTQHQSQNDANGIGNGNSVPAASGSGNATGGKMKKITLKRPAPGGELKEFRSE